MSTPLNKVRRFIKRNSMLESSAGVLVAVSGGADSVVLLDMLARLTSEDEGRRPVRAGNRTSNPDQRTQVSGRLFANTKPRIHVAHLDHRLRARESTEDAVFVRGLADRLGFACTIRSTDVRAVAEARGRGIEEMARELRYDFLFSAARDAGCDRIAVGHTMTDQAETFLMRLLRGAGSRGLAAMRPVSSAHVFDLEPAEGAGQIEDDESSASVLLIRPLLCITREEVEQYCEQRSLEFRTDSTNSDLQYTRNQVRNEVFPLLATINPRVEESIARAAENIAGDQEVLDHLASSVLDQARLAADPGSKGWNPGEGTVVYSVTRFLEEPVALRRRMIIKACRTTRESIAVELASEGEITTAHVSAIERLLEPGASGKRVTLPGLVDVWREFDALAFRPRTQVLDKPINETTISVACADVEAGGFAFTLQRDQPVELLKSIVEETQRAARRTGQDWMSVGLDDEALPDSLIIRPRLAGERAQVAGHRELIKLKNLMIDHRIPSSRRATWPVVTTLDGCYVWSPGLPPSTKFAAQDGTKRVAIMRASAV